MSKASSILLKVGFILAIVVGAILLISAAGFIVLGLPNITKEIITEKDVKAEDLELARLVWSICFIASGALFLMLAVASGLSSYFSYKARLIKTKKAYIVSLVFGAIISTPSLVGSIFGLISLKNRK